jgi:hypothetical protein
MDNHYRSTSNITNNKKSSPCSGGLITNVAMTISESARPGVYECLDRHVCFLVGTSSEE